MKSLGRPRLIVRVASARALNFHDFGQGATIQSFSLETALYGRPTAKEGKPIWIFSPPQAENFWVLDM